MIDKAVILAAGTGNRISGVALDVPKPLLPLSGAVGGPTFLDWHCRALERHGVREIYVVGNQKTFGTKLPLSSSVKSTWILNPTADLSTSGSGHSTWFAWESEHRILDGESRVVLMDADILYDPDIYRALDEHPSPRSKTLVCAEYRDTQEEVLVFAEPGAPEVPVYHGKGMLRTPMTEGFLCIGEATGILLWEPGDHDALRRVTNWVMQYSTAKKRSEHEDITQRMMLAKKMVAVSFDRSLAFMECDTPDEYAVLTSEVYPRLCDKLSF